MDKVSSTARTLLKKLFFLELKIVSILNALDASEFFSGFPGLLDFHCLLAFTYLISCQLKLGLLLQCCNYFETFSPDKHPTGIFCFF